MIQPSPTDAVTANRAASPAESLDEADAQQVRDKLRRLPPEVGAVIVLRPGVTLSGPDIASFVTARIARFKGPQYVAFYGEPLPRNAGGKVLKPKLRDDIDWGPPLW